MRAERRTNRFSCLVSFLAVTLLPAAAWADSQMVGAAHREILVQSTQSWNGKPYESYPHGPPQLTVMRLAIPAHTALPWHTHPYPNAVYVLSGDLTIEDKTSGCKRTFHTGEAFTESVDDVHRGASGDAPAVLIITYSGAPGVPPFKLEPGEGRGN